MNDFKFDTLDDIKKSIADFYKIPIRSRFIISNKIHSRLKELDEYVKVSKDNPILNYPSERFIVDDKYEYNEYSKFQYYLDKGDIEQYNFSVYNDIDLAADKLTGIYDIVRLCREQNNKADELYLVKYPTHGDMIAVFKKAVTMIEMCFLYEFVESMAVSAMDDIEFIISTNILTDSHVHRLLLSPMKLVQMPIFSKRFENIRPRLVKLFNTQISLVKQRKDEFLLNMPYDNAALKSYLKIQKIGHEERLLSMDNNGDYDIKGTIPSVNIMEAVAIDEPVLDMYKNIKPINMIDKFILEEHGFFPIIPKSYNGQDYYMHVKHDVQYNLYRSIVKENTYFMFTRLPNSEVKSYKITINDTKPAIDKLTSSAMLESTFITDFKKMNR